MSKYNIIYISPADDPYLWNGTTLDKLEHTGQEMLLFSGKSFQDKELKDGIKDCHAAAKVLFPEDTDPKIKTVEIKVG
jgi:hypothetical protein